jgi:hypothetical protein
MYYIGQERPEAKSRVCIYLPYIPSKHPYPDLLLS